LLQPAKISDLLALKRERERGLRQWDFGHSQYSSSRLCSRQ